MTATKETPVGLPLVAGPRRPRANTIGDSQPSRTLEKGAVPRDCCSSGSFVTKLYKMVDTEPATIVSWIRGGTAFCIVDPKMMAEHCLPKYFRHRRFSSLIRQLNFYSFYRVQEGQLTIYQHSFFRKGRPDLLVHIKRRGAGKAKDPWFDPLAPPAKPPAPLPMNTLLPNSHLEGGLTLPTGSTTTLGSATGMICYSPMAKPLPGTIDNMSPALKPGVAQLAPPLVDLGGSSFVDGGKLSDSHRWENHLLSFQDSKVEFGNGPMVKADVGFTDMNFLSTAGLMKPMAGATHGTSMSSIDIDIQDFLTDDCSINSGIAEKTMPDERNLTFVCSTQFHPKRALVGRDCLKLESNDDSDGSRNATEDDSAFEQELLSDLATVEPGTWEVPLSPLNDEEDVMPWLDLCF